MSSKPKYNSLNRRHILQGATVLAASGWATGAVHAQATGKIAVVFLSRSSNTRMLAGDLARRFAGDLFEIRPQNPWPEDYEEMVDWATRWREDEELLPLDTMPDLSAHTTIFLGFPIWGGALPAPMRSFLSTTSLSNKMVLPFITHGGYGPGDAMAEIQNLAPNATYAEEFVLQCDQERDNLNALNGWLDDVGTAL